jgi:hypothetical protein
MPTRRQSLATIAEAEFTAWLPGFIRERFGLAIRPAPSKSDLRGFDLAFSLDQDGQARLLLVEIKSRWLRSFLPETRTKFQAVREQRPPHIPVLAVPALSPRLRSELRDAGINHVDLEGAAYVSERGLYIDVDPARTPGRLSQMRTPHMPADAVLETINPFSDAASVVLRLLLSDPDRAWRIQDLASAGKMNPGWVATVARAIESRGYATRSQRGSGRESDLQIADPVAALQDWSDVYTWRANHMTSYNIPFEYHELTQRIGGFIEDISAGESSVEFPVALTLHSGADLYAAHVQHEQLHAYVQANAFTELDERIRIDFHGKAVDRGGSGNLHLLQPYYRRSVFVGARMRNGLPVVSPVQLYLDLINYPVRGKEAADVLARAVLGPEWGLSSEQLRRLLA